MSYNRLIRSTTARLPCDRECRGCRQFVFRLPGWPNQSTHLLQDVVNVLATHRRRRVAKHTFPIVPMHSPATLLARRRQGLAIHYRVSEGLRPIVIDPFLGRRWELRAHPDRDTLNRHWYRGRQRLETLACASRRCFAHALHE